MVTFVNMTPHPVCICGPNGEILHTFPKSGQVARAEEECEGQDPIEGILVVRKTYSPSELPDPKDGVRLIVSLLVAQVATDRHDLVVPDTGSESCVRDDEGRILGVRRFQVV